jgi:hypothetical protein
VWVWKQPFSQQLQEMSWGSLKRSKMTRLSFLKVDATLAQKAGAWSSSAMGGVRTLDMLVPGAFICRTRIGLMPCDSNRSV